MQLNFQSYGGGFPLIILHGLFGSLDNWQTISRRLGEFFEVFAVDQRNHGLSPHDDVLNYQVMAEDLLEFIQARRFSRVHLLGHSMGGKTAMQFALLHPESVGKLVVADIAPKAYPPGHLPIFNTLLSLDLNSMPDRQAVENALAASIPEITIRRFLLKNLTRDESGAFHWKFNLPAIYRNYNQLNQGLNAGEPFKGPVLFIRGGRSDYIRKEDEPLIKSFFPQSKIATLPAAGHWVHAEMPEEFIKTTLDFLR